MFRKYLPYALILILIISSYFIVKPYITVFLISCVLAYTFYPLYNITKKVLKNKIISALFVSFLSILIMFLLAGFILLGIYSEAFDTVNNLRDTFYGEEGILNCEAENNWCDRLENISSTLSDENLNKYIDIQRTTNLISNQIMDRVRNFFTSIPKAIMNFTIIIFIMYYLFKDGKNLIEYISEKINLRKEDHEILLTRIKETANSIIFGSLIIALIQGIAGSLGYWMIGISSPLLWGVAIAFFSLIPVLGTAIVWLPQSVYLILTGLDDGTWVKGALLLTYSFFIVGGVDNILRPIMLGTKAKIHPVIILLGILGGIPLFGLMGIILGPIILGICVKIFEFTTEKKGEVNDKTKSKKHRHKHRRSSSRSSK